MAKQKRKNRIKIHDLPANRKISEEELKHVTGGGIGVYAIIDDNNSPVAIIDDNNSPVALQGTMNTLQTSGGLFDTNKASGVEPSPFKVNR